MNTHKNSLLTPKGRLQMVRAVVDDGMTMAAAARRYTISTKTVNKWVGRFVTDGVDGLRDRSSRPHSAKPSDGEELKKQLFTVLHAPPSDYGFNRTTWKLNDLHRALEKSGTRIGRHAMRKIIRDAGYRWVKARKVLTSNDPDYRDKVDQIHRILSGLQDTEGFFSIDEFGPFAVKHRQGKKLVAPGEVFTVPQWQKSKGSLIVTAALELFTNQITHFYSEKKNSGEMVKLLNFLLQNHRHLDRIYLSWDAAPWHESNKLFEKIESNNVMAKVTGSTHVCVAPLPAGAQFLNVIEAVFSGLARAVIHNSNYQSIEEAKHAIDRYFNDRNNYFRENPKRAGRKIWGKPGVSFQFSESLNYKDPKYR
jgi:transposase